MKGGYQIIDLTTATAGDPVTISGVFDVVKGNNGKAILIKTADDQDVFAQAKEVDGDYVITYLSAEGKTVKVTITDEDAVTTVIEDDGASIEALSQAVNEISGKVDANDLGTQVTLDTYSSTDNMYTLPSDGYVYGVTSDTQGERININIYGSQGTSGGAFSVTLKNTAGGGNSHESVPVFCRKGMKCYVANRGTDSHAYFTPIS